MSNVNPNKPAVLGVEWVPLRGVQRPLDIQTEYGYGFSVTGAPNNNLGEAPLFFYPPGGGIQGQTLFYNVYPRGREDDTGPINVVRIGLSNAAVTGATVTGSSFTFDANADRIRLQAASIPAQLNGKRILGIDLVYRASGSAGFALEPTLENFTVVYPYGPYITGPLTQAQVVDEQTVRFGDVNPFWNIGSSLYPSTIPQRFPFRYQELLNLVSGSTLFVGVRTSTMPLSGSAIFTILGLDVYYCEESRVAYGGVAMGTNTSSNGLTFTSVSTGYVDGSSSTGLHLRDPSFNTNPLLSVGDYTILGGLADAGDYYNQGDKIAIGSLFQYRQVATHPTGQVVKFQRPVGNRPVTPPVYSTSDYMNGVSMYGSPLSWFALQGGEAPFVYYTMDGAPVYITPGGVSVTAVQQIHNEASASDTSYEQVRFYARRFNPTAPGDLWCTVSGSGIATITPAQFAALDELTIGEYGDGTGWREITLPITAVFSSDASFRNVTFSMQNVATSTAADQWQILVARIFIPSTTAILNTGDTSYSHSIYDGLQSATLTWKAPEVSGTSTTDTRSTAVVMFSQDPPAPTGVSLTNLSMPITGTIMSCNTPDSCIPTGIGFQRVSWSSMGIVCDSGSRTSASTFGTPDTGQTITYSGGVNSDYTANGSVLQVNMTTTIRNAIYTPGPGNDFDAVATFSTPAVASGASIQGYLAGSVTGGTTGVNGFLLFTTSGTVQVNIGAGALGAGTVGTAVTVGSYTASQRWKLRVRRQGTIAYVKAWPESADEPLGWQSSSAGTSLAAQTGSDFAIGASLAGGNTNTLPLAMSIDDVQATSLAQYGGYWEVQRHDTVDPTWQVIAELSPCATSFDDYEARVAVYSEYRIRYVTTDGFYGPYSSQVSGTIASPGVAGAGDGNSVLIFTTNQGPSGNVAYTMVWDGIPDETFGFPEAGQPQIRQQFQRDFWTSYHGTERGGETFSRELLIRNASYPASAQALGQESLADLKPLRELAWADIPYVCVRDELGNRWFAFIQVPGISVKRNRQLYVASISITESTETPAPAVTT